jgi:hypothetical protein
MWVDKLEQAGWGDAADYFRERIIKYSMTELKVPVVGKPNTVITAATLSPTTFGELMQTPDIFSGQSQMLHVTS